MLMSTAFQSIRRAGTSYSSGFRIRHQRVLSANSPTEPPPACPAQKQPVTWHGLRPFDFAQGVLNNVERRGHRHSEILKRPLIMGRGFRRSTMSRLTVLAMALALGTVACG